MGLNVKLFGWIADQLNKSKVLIQCGLLWIKEKIIQCTRYVFVCNGVLNLYYKFSFVVK